MKKFINNTLTFLITHKWYILGFLILGFILFTNTFHEKYPDEFDNILGGKFILQGVFPNTGFFTHHGPFAYFFSAFILLFSGVSFVKFRILLALLYWFAHLGLFSYIRNRFGKIPAIVSLVWSILVALTSSFNWGHMLLSDSLAGLLVVPAILILFFFYFEKKKLRYIDIFLLSFLLAATFLTAFTYVFVVIVLYILLLATVLHTKSLDSSTTLSKKQFGEWLQAAIIVVSPYLVFCLYLLFTKGFSDFYYQTIFFNTQYYLAGSDASTVSNPIRFAITLLVKYIDAYRIILVQVPSLNFEFPFAITLALANTLLPIVLLFKRKFFLSLTLFILTAFINVRSSILTIKETDYQSAPYHFLALFFGVLLIALLISEIKQHKETFLKPIYYLFLLLFSAYFFFCTFFVFNNWLQKVYSKFMGTAPLIYDRPVIAPVLNQLLLDGEYYYIGPFHFEEHLYIKPELNLASKYFITIPAMDNSEKIQNELIADLQNNKPKIIVFDSDYVIFNSFPGSFLLKFLDTQYVTLGTAIENQKEYELVKETLEQYNLKTHIYIEKTHLAEVLALLETIGWLQKI